MLYSLAELTFQNILLIEKCKNGDWKIEEATVTLFWYTYKMDWIYKPIKIEDATVTLYWNTINITVRKDNKKR